MEVKIVLNDPKTGKSYQKQASADAIEHLIGKNIGDEVDLSFLDLSGYSGQISGGSYMTGTPMKKGVDGIALKQILIEKGIGNRQGIRRRKSVAGSTVGQFTSQVNIKITKYGEKPLEQAPEEKKQDG